MPLAGVLRPLGEYFESFFLALSLLTKERKENGEKKENQEEKEKSRKKQKKKKSH